MIVFIVFLEFDYYNNRNKTRYYLLSNLFLCIIVIAMMFYLSFSIEFLIIQRNSIILALPGNNVLLDQLSSLISTQETQYQKFRE